MILPLTSLCRFCLQYTETFVYFNDAIDWMVLLMLLLIKISILYELFKKIILKKDMYMFVFDPLIGMGPCLVIVILGFILHSSDVCVCGRSRLNFRAEDPRGWSQCFYIVFLLGFFSKADLREGDHGELKLPGVDDPHLSTDTVIEFQRIFRFV